MRVYKCDRCGLLYENKKGTRWTVYEQYYSKDLCPDCYQKLENFMNYERDKKEDEI